MTTTAQVLLGGEEAFQVSGQEEGDLVCLGGFPVAGPDLQDAPAGTGQGVVQVPVRVPLHLQNPFLQQDGLLEGIPVHGGCCHLWGGITKY